MIFTSRELVKGVISGTGACVIASLAKSLADGVSGGFRIVVDALTYKGCEENCSEEHE